MLYWLFNGMARVSSYTVHEPPHAAGTKFDRAERVRFVADGFSWLAALFSPLYLIVRGEWIALVAYIAAALLLAAMVTLTGAGDHWLTWMFLLLNIVTGFELNELKRWSLGRAGWQEIATVSGRGQEEAERRFFDVWLPTISADTPAMATAFEPHSTAGPWSSPPEDTTSRIEGAVRRLSERLRTKYMPKT